MKKELATFGEYKKSKLVIFGKDERYPLQFGKTKAGYFVDAYEENPERVIEMIYEIAERTPGEEEADADEESETQAA
jgi:hypothetical protein